MTLAIAFIGGIVSCLSPCVLPLIPVFVGHVLGGGAAAAVPRGGSAAAVAVGRQRAAGFLLGFGGVFIALWVSLGLVGFAFLGAIPAARQVAGIAIVGLGIVTAAGWQPMDRMGSARVAHASSFGSSALLGAGVAVGWTPCIGPTLGAILTLAAASSTVWAGAALLIAYAFGMAVPFVAVALGVQRFRALTRSLGRHALALRFATGALMAGVGVLVATGGFGRLAGLIPWIF